MKKRIKHILTVPYRYPGLLQINIENKIQALVIIMLMAMCLFMHGIPTHAQTTITLKQAIDTALINNRVVKNERMRTEYKQTLIRSGATIPPSHVFGEFGQMNSPGFDTRWGVSQTIHFPRVYASQKNLLREDWKGGLLNVAVQEAELKRRVAITFTNMRYLQQKKKILQENDSLFSAFLNKANLRFSKGESNILEKTTAENQRGQIALQMTQWQHDWELAQLQFQLLLNTDTRFDPAENEPDMTTIQFPDNMPLEDHPATQYWRQQQDMAIANTKVEQTKLLPDLSLAYNLMSMKGLVSDHRIYNGIPRFQSFQIGLGIPVFTGGQKARIKASKINEQMATNDLEIYQQKMASEYASAQKNFKKYEETVRYYELTALKNAEIIRKTAHQQFLSGDINFLEWVILMNQTTSIQSDYTEAVRDKNLAVAELIFYLNQ